MNIYCVLPSLCRKSQLNINLQKISVDVHGILTDTLSIINNTNNENVTTATRNMRR